MKYVMVRKMRIIRHNIGFREFIDEILSFTIKIPISIDQFKS